MLHGFDSAIHIMEGGDEFLTLLPADETKQFKDAVMKLVAQLQAGESISKTAKDGAKAERDLAEASK